VSRIGGISLQLRAREWRFFLAPRVVVIVSGVVVSVVITVTFGDEMFNS
jgi:hypothetical protein